MVNQGLLNRLGEDSKAAELRERTILNLIAMSIDKNDFDGPGEQRQVAADPGCNELARERVDCRGVPSRSDCMRLTQRKTKPFAAYY